MYDKITKIFVFNITKETRFLIMKMLRNHKFHNRKVKAQSTVKEEKHCISYLPRNTVEASVYSLF